MWLTTPIKALTRVADVALEELLDVCVSGFMDSADKANQMLTGTRASTCVGFYLSPTRSFRVGTAVTESSEPVLGRLRIPGVLGATRNGG